MKHRITPEQLKERKRKQREQEREEARLEVIEGRGYGVTTYQAKRAMLFLLISFLIITVGATVYEFYFEDRTTTQAQQQEEDDIKPRFNLKTSEGLASYITQNDSYTIVNEGMGSTLISVTDKGSSFVQGHPFEGKYVVENHNAELFTLHSTDNKGCKNVSWGSSDSIVGNVCLDKEKNVVVFTGAAQWKAKVPYLREGDVSHAVIEDSLGEVSWTLDAVENGMVLKNITPSVSHAEALVLATASLAKAIEW